MEGPLRRLLQGRMTGALGTLHSGAPYVSMVPFALLEDGPAFVIHVSRLAGHTQDMLANPRVSLLVSAAEQPGVSPLALARVTLLGTARPISADDPEYGAARQAYLARFPDAAAMFGFADFSLFLIAIEKARWVAGFAEARTLSAGAFARAIMEKPG